MRRLMEMQMPDIASQECQGSGQCLCHRQQALRLGNGQCDIEISCPVCRCRLARDRLVNQIAKARRDHQIKSDGIWDSEAAEQFAERQIELMLLLRFVSEADISRSEEQTSELQSLR